MLIFIRSAASSQAELPRMWWLTSKPGEDKIGFYANSTRHLFCGVSLITVDRMADFDESETKCLWFS
jgi:hypothetical protein